MNNTPTNFTISHSPHAAEFCEKEHFSLTPYDRETRENGYYAIIDRRSAKQGSISSCLVHCSDAVKDELGKYYWPGGITMKFIQQKGLNWLVVFSAQNALISAYAKVTN